mgnify:CR=1 FL=1
MGIWLYLAFWVLVYVATQYRAEKRVRELYNLRKELTEKRAEYLRLNALLSQKRNYSAMKPLLDSLGLQLPREAPFVVAYE